MTLHKVLVAPWPVLMSVAGSFHMVSRRVLMAVKYVIASLDIVREGSF